MNFVVKPYDSVELGQVRVFLENVYWEEWSSLPTQDRLMQGSTCFKRVITANTIAFVVQLMDEDGYCNLLLENGILIKTSVDRILLRSRLM